MVKVIDLVIGFIIFSILVVSISVFWADLENSYDVEVEEEFKIFFERVQNTTETETQAIAQNMSIEAEGEGVGFFAEGGIKDKVVAALKLPFQMFMVVTSYTTQAITLTGLPVPAWIVTSLLSIITTIIIYTLLVMFFGRTK